MIGPLAGLIQGETFTYDRWLWLKDRLPATRNGERLLDVGCGTGAFTIAAAGLGYKALGLSWDEGDMRVAQERASICNVQDVGFRVCDVRRLDQEQDLVSSSDVVLCLENIEHILDDRKLIIDIGKCLADGGRLLLTTPNYYYKALSAGDRGPFETEELGWHVRRGYSKAQLMDLFSNTGLLVEEISYCSGFFSQKATALMRLFGGRLHIAGWFIVLPLRPFLPLLDAIFHKLFEFPSYSICVVAYKARFTR